jgi:hypothetical protein
MKSIVDINNLNLKDYYFLWEEFWFNKFGYYSNGIEKIISKKTFAQARKDDEVLEKEFVEFYNNKIIK